MNFTRKPSIRLRLNELLRILERKIVKRFLLAYIFTALLAGSASPPEYSIQAIRYATAPGLPVSMLVIGAPKDEKIDAAMVIWLIRGGGHTILFDSGFHRDTFAKRFPTNDYTDARHTYASEYLRIDGHTPYVLASDNVSLYLNLTSHRA